MILQNAVLDYDVMVGVEETGLLIVIVDHFLPIVRQQFANAGVPFQLGTPKSINDPLINSILQPFELRSHLMHGSLRHHLRFKVI